MMAWQALNGGPRGRLGTANLLANDITRIAHGVANSFVHSLVNKTHHEELYVAIAGLRERLQLLEDVARNVQAADVNGKTPPP